MAIRIGSIESSDLKIEILKNNSQIRIKNLVPELDDEMVEEAILQKLEKMNLIQYNPTVYYNGANEWVINARLEAIKNTIQTRKIEIW